MLKTIYKLLDKEEAKEGKNNGLTLLYSVYSCPVIPITVGNFNMYISIPWKRTKKEKIKFLNPFKKKWDTHRHRLSRNYWGKKDNPLTNLWLKVKNKQIDGSRVLILDDQELNHDVIRNLKLKNNQFYIIKKSKSNGTRKRN